MNIKTKGLGRVILLRVSKQMGYKSIVFILIQGSSRVALFWGRFITVEWGNCGGDVVTHGSGGSRRADPLKKGLRQPGIER